MIIPVTITETALVAALTGAATVASADWLLHLAAEGFEAVAAGLGAK